MKLVGGERDLPVAGRGNDTVTTGIQVPSWATRVVVDVTMARKQWERFTDFGLTLFDSAGRQVDNAPLDYSFGRIEAGFDAGHPSETVSVALFPAPAEAGSREEWQAVLSVRLYAGDQMPLSAVPGGPSVPAEEQTTLFTLPPLPWPLPADVSLLGLLEVTHQGRVWTREVPLPENAGRSTQ